MPSLHSRCSLVSLIPQTRQLLVVGLAFAAISLPQPRSGTAHARSDADESAALIAAGIEHNFAGNLEEANATWKQLRDLDPQHPRAAVFEIFTLYWQESYEPQYPGLDEQIEARCDQAIEQAVAWVDRSPNSAQAHYYLGEALMSLGRLNGTRGRFFRAGSLGEESRGHLERALELDPTIVDAKYQLGLYSFYASLLPSFTKWLSFLWFVPTGDAEKGLSLLEEVERSNGTHRYEAALILMNIHTYHRSNRRDYALELAQRLHTEFPLNTVIHFELIELLFAEEEYAEVIREAMRLEQQPRERPRDRGRANVARIWRARALLALGKVDLAWETLASFGRSGPDLPSWGHRWVALSRGQILDVQEQREQAKSRYQRVIDLGFEPVWSRSTRLALQGMESPFRVPQSGD